MKKDKKNQKKRKKFLEKQVRADKTTEFIVHDSPTKTWWGKLILALILIGFIVVPVIGLIIILFTS